MIALCRTLTTAALLLGPAAVIPPAATLIPPAQGTALDGHAVTFPHDLASATILILGYTQHSVDSTTAWERPIRDNLANLPAIGYFDMPFLEDAPAFVRPLIVRSIRKQVPSMLRPYFVPLTSGEAAWKQLTHFTPGASDAAYVLLVDREGQVRWQTHEAFSPSRFDELATAARRLAAEGK